MPDPIRVPVQLACPPDLRLDDLCLVLAGLGVRLYAQPTVNRPTRQPVKENRREAA